MSKYFITQHVLLLIGYIYYSEPATSLDLSKKMFLLALQTRPPQFLLPPRWEKIYDLLNFFSVEERDDSRTEPNLVNKGGDLVIQTLNLCAGALSCKNKTPLDSFPRLFSLFFSRRVVSNVE